jgi:hypothetical protein
LRRDRRELGDAGAGSAADLAFKLGGARAAKSDDHACRVAAEFQSTGTDGNAPEAGLIADTAGNLFDTTVNGGANGLANPPPQSVRHNSLSIVKVC